VMGFYSFVVLGMAPFGSFQAGWIAEHIGVRAAVGLGGVACFLVAAAVAWRMRERGSWGQPALAPTRSPPNEGVA
jgi:hypothetical protein